MIFQLASTFTAALTRLNASEQKQAKIAALDLQINPSQPGLKMHRLSNVRDRNFWSVRVSQDLRIIVHKTQASLMLAYVDHHDRAYAWAERRKINTHSGTGAIQLLELPDPQEDFIARLAERRYASLDRAFSINPPTIVERGSEFGEAVINGEPNFVVMTVQDEGQFRELLGLPPCDTASSRLADTALGGQAPKTFGKATGPAPLLGLRHNLLRRLARTRQKSRNGN